MFTYRLQFTLGRHTNVGVMNGVRKREEGEEEVGLKLRKLRTDVRPFPQFSERENIALPSFAARQACGVTTSKIDIQQQSMFFPLFFFTFPRLSFFF